MYKSSIHEHPININIKDKNVYFSSHPLNCFSNANSCCYIPHRPLNNDSVESLHTNALDLDAL